MTGDIRDIKPPVNFPNNLQLWLFAAAAALFLAGVIYVFLAFRRRAAANMLLAAKPAHETAYEALRKLKEEGLIAQGLIKEYYFRLSFIVRRYIEERFRLRAPEMTTEEFLEGLRGSDKLDGRLKELLKGFLSEADMVKFAKYGPSEKEIEAAFDAAKNLVDRTKEVKVES